MVGKVAPKHVQNERNEITFVTGTWILQRGIAGVCISKVMLQTTKQQNNSAALEPCRTRGARENAVSDVTL